MVSIHPFIHPVNGNRNHSTCVSDHFQVNQYSSLCRLLNAKSCFIYIYIYIWFVNEKFVSNILNKPELICLLTVYWLHVLQSNTNNSTSIIYLRNRIAVGVFYNFSQLGYDSRIRFQKAVTDNNNNRLKDSHHYLLYIKFGFRKVFCVLSWLRHWADRLRLSKRIHFSSQIRSKNGSFKFPKNSIEHTSKRQKLFDFHRVHVEPIYRVSSTYQFSWYDQILLKCWYQFLETFLGHFDLVFVQQVFSDAGRQLRTDVLFLLDLQHQYSHDETSGTSAILSNHKWILHPMQKT